MALTESSSNTRERLLAAAKSLFAQRGYEHTSTSAIAREAGTSESQLVRYFGGKVGLLEAIYNEGWQQLNRTVQRLAADAPDARSALVGVVSTVLMAFRRDADLARVLLFEGRRLRGEKHEIRVSMGFREFSEIFQRLVRRGQQDGTFSEQLDPAAVASALMGAAEGMVRDWMFARQAGLPVPFSEKAIQQMFETLVACLPSSKRKK